MRVMWLRGIDMTGIINKVLNIITENFVKDTDFYDIPLSRPKPLANIIELQHYRENCPKKCHPSGDCDTHCHASDYYYRKYPDGIIRGQWYCKASPTLEEFEPDYRKESKRR